MNNYTVLVAKWYVHHSAGRVILTHSEFKLSRWSLFSCCLSPQRCDVLQHSTTSSPAHKHVLQFFIHVHRLSVYRSCDVCMGRTVSSMLVWQTLVTLPYHFVPVPGLGAPNEITECSCSTRRCMISCMQVDQSRTLWFTLLSHLQTFLRWLSIPVSWHR